MKHFFAGKSFTFYSLIIFLVLVVSFSCKPCKIAREPYRFIKADTSEIVVLIKPGNSRDDFNKWLDSMSREYGPIQIVNACANCDSSLMLLAGVGVNTYVSGTAAIGGSGTGSKTPVTGEDGPVYFSYNFPIDLNDSIVSDANYQYKPVEITNTTKRDVVVAIFDTGEDPEEFRKVLFSGDANNCIGPQARNGWNFADHTQDWTDNHKSKHGTVVGRFITDQVLQYGGNGVKILPVKVHNNAGISSLFDVLCGFSYASKQHADIINASFGFYAPRYYGDSRLPDASGDLMKRFIEKYLLENHILLIAAAGNESALESMVYNPANPAQMRNLDSVDFFPGSFARELPNVITVTTVHTTEGKYQVSPFQNYSKEVVDIGVNADIFDSYAFINPRSNGAPGATVIGSSFATPIVTGKICANYFLIEPLLTQPGFTKFQILSALAQAGLVHISAPETLIKVKNNIMMNKNR